MFKLNFKYLGLYLLLVLIAVLLFFGNSIEEEGSYLTINNQRFEIEIAKTTKERNQGLSGRESLGEREGMLFIFNKAGLYSFWMKEMKFSLDFVFIREGKVVDLVKEVPSPQKGESPEVVDSKTNFDQVLEVKGETIEKFKIRLGDKVELFF